MRRVRACYRTGCEGAATTLATIRQTSGNTISSVGKATSHDSAQAPGQVARNAGVAPRLRRVEMTDTTAVMRMDSTNGITIGA